MGEILTTWKRIPLAKRVITHQFKTFIAVYGRAHLTYDGSRLIWTLFFPEYVGMIKNFYGELVATLHPLPGRWPCISLRTSIQ
jgi:hypothetical protein